MNTGRALWRRVPRPAVDAGLAALAALDAWGNLHDEAATPFMWACVALGCAGLLLRRYVPLAVVLLTLPMTLFLDVAVAPLAALYTLATRTRNRPLLAGCALLSTAAGTLVWPLSESFSGDRTWTLVQFVYTLATSFAPVLVGQLVQARRDLRRQLVEIEEVREHERALYAQNVLARERAQLAREMHDVVSHQVSLIAVQAAALQVAAHDPGQAVDGARAIRTLSVNTLDELRHMVTLLRASSGKETELSPQPTLADLKRLIAGSGIETTLTGELPPGISTTAQRTIYRTVQEALTNVRKHAPGARADIHLWHDPHHFGVTVTNTAPTRPTVPLPSAHHGLIGLRERAELLDGTFTAGPTLPAGYRVELRAPRQSS
ncbi:two-component sensor histidine kinase [Streptomyces sp. V2]|uniref:histidine kinase n=1 Tax=Streptomyces niveiscabiei TaxID=164115 RepID=A0ABW9HUJ6_9ACTN|nr:MULTISPECIES: sensor histidine kinase [unclassified Streptomyces]PWG07641.1 two-component sensor histidine kinase [Streptomyces sp. V2]QZZ28947.1 two-component sensor histidine kinase [Streptomyces sp. ST1015]